MNQLELSSVKVGSLRVGGLLGHGISLVSQAALAVVRSRPVRRFTMAAAITAVLSVGVGHVVRIGMRTAHENAMKSIVPKDNYVVEDVHGAGQYMIVRSGEKHIRLKCTGSQWKDESHSSGWQHDMSCAEFKPGETIRLERWKDGLWNSMVYVYKKKQIEGEDDYVALDKEDD